MGQGQHILGVLALTSLLGAASGPGNATNATSGPCVAPSHILNISAPGCLEGPVISDDHVCTPTCQRGFTPSQSSLLCTSGELQLQGFSCESACAEQGAKLPAIAGPSAPHLCEHVSCGALVVTHGEGLAMVALGLLGHVPCREIRPWNREHVLARTDVLVVSVADFEGVPTDVLQQQGFTGVVVWVDLECDVQDPDGLSAEELQRRLFAAGVGVPNAANHSRLVQMYAQAGMPPAVPPALRCWEPRTVYAGADRGAASVHAALLEFPPGSQLMLHGDLEQRRLRAHLDVLRQEPRSVAPAASKPKLMAYIADRCLPEAEVFFDLVFEMLGGLGAVEALGDCFGSHPEARPAACSGSSRAGLCREARSDAATALAPYRFALAFEASAGSVWKCPRHVGGSVLIPALVAGAVPVYRGPMEAYEAVNLSAVVLIPASASMKQAVSLFRAAIDDGAMSSAMAAAAALPDRSVARWFQWDAALQSQPTEIGRALVSLLEDDLAAASPHGRCLAHAQEQVGLAGHLGEL